VGATLAALHHYRRTGGSEQGQRQLVLATVIATLALTAGASISVAT
jgi:hypothetical protein